jgi:hypothetical protein
MFLSSIEILPLDGLRLMNHIYAQHGPPLCTKVYGWVFVFVA